MATFSIYTIAGNQSIVEGSFSGEGYPRLFEADSEIYIYGLSNALMMTPNTGTTFTNIMPPGYLTVKAICKSSNTVIVPSNTSASTRIVLYQEPPEVSTNWSASTGSLPTNFVAVDAIADDIFSVVPIIGNSTGVFTPRAVRGAAQAPHSPWVDSGTGLPTSGTGTQISDLEIGG